MSAPFENAAIAAETALVGITLNGDISGAELLTEQDFVKPAHWLVASAAARLHRQGVDVNVLTVADELQQAGSLRQVGGIVQLTNLLSDAPPGHVAAPYARMVRRYAQLRWMRDVGARLAALSGEQSYDDVEEVQAVAERDLRAMPPDLADEDPEGALEAHTARFMRYRPPSPRKWLIPGGIARMDRVMVTGYEGLAKSVYLRQIAACVAAGLNPWNGDRVSDGWTVLQVDCENNQDQTDDGIRFVGARIEQRMFDRDWDRRWRIYCRPEGINLRGRDLPWLNRLADVVKPDLIVIGPFYKLMKGDRNSDIDVMEVLEGLDDLRARHDAALLIEAHSPLPPGGQSDRPPRPYGNSVQLGWPEIGFGLRPDQRESVRLASGEDFMRLQRVTHLECKDFRGRRVNRDWPRFIRYGSLERKELPWVPTSEGWSPSIDGDYTEQPAFAAGDGW
jgi:hypothetical protein